MRNLTRTIAIFGYMLATSVSAAPVQIPPIPVAAKYALAGEFSSTFDALTGYFTITASIGMVQFPGQIVSTTDPLLNGNVTSFVDGYLVGGQLSPLSGLLTAPDTSVRMRDVTRRLLVGQDVAYSDFAAEYDFQATYNVPAGDFYLWGTSVPATNVFFNRSLIHSPFLDNVTGGVYLQDAGYIKSGEIWIWYESWSPTPEPGTLFLAPLGLGLLLVSGQSVRKRRNGQVTHRGRPISLRFIAT